MENKGKRTRILWQNTWIYSKVVIEAGLNQFYIRGSMFKSSRLIQENSEEYIEDQ